MINPTATISSVYLAIPITLGTNHYIASSEFDYPTQPATATFRIMMNSSTVNSSRINGLVWEYYAPNTSSGGSKGSLPSSTLSVNGFTINLSPLNSGSGAGTTYAFIQFPPLSVSGANKFGCTYVDLTWFYPEGGAKVFYKTSTGAAGFINLRIDALNIEGIE
jgi:hypothetical protein